MVDIHWNEWLYCLPEGTAVNDKPPVDGVVTISKGRDDGSGIGDRPGSGDRPATDDEPAIGDGPVIDDGPATDDNEWLTGRPDDAEAAGASEKWATATDGPVLSSKYGGVIEWLLPNISPISSKNAGYAIFPRPVFLRLSMYFFHYATHHTVNTFNSCTQTSSATLQSLYIFFGIDDKKCTESRWTYDNAAPSQRC